VKGGADLPWLASLPHCSPCTHPELSYYYATQWNYLRTHRVELLKQLKVGSGGPVITEKAFEKRSLPAPISGKLQLARPLYYHVLTSPLAAYTLTTQYSDLETLRLTNGEDIAGADGVQVFV